MEQYISKDALIAEITKIYDRNRSNGFIDVCDKLDNILSFVDTLEVKEIDWEKEAELIADGIMIGVQANKYHRCVYNTTKCDFNHSHLMLAARKGIEVGLKAAQKGEEV
jgi:hypothetical protein